MDNVYRFVRKVNIMKKPLMIFVAKLILIFLIGIHLAPVMYGLMLGLNNLNRPNTYLGPVETPTYPEVKQYLLELNNRGYGEVVKVNGKRPIIVLENYLNDENQEDGDTLGMAFDAPLYCTIFLDKKSLTTPSMVRYTIWHEYLHCFGYGHSDDPTDIMYYAHSPRLNPDSVDKYLKEIKETYE